MILLAWLSSNNQNRQSISLLASIRPPLIIGSRQEKAAVQPLWAGRSCSPMTHKPIRSRMNLANH